MPARFHSIPSDDVTVGDELSLFVSSQVHGEDKNLNDPSDAPPPLPKGLLLYSGLLSVHWFVSLLITKVTFAVKSPISPFGSSRQLAASVQLSVALLLVVTWFNIIIIVPRCTGICKPELPNLNPIALPPPPFFCSFCH